MFCVILHNYTFYIFIKEMCWWILFTYICIIIKDKKFVFKKKHQLKCFLFCLKRSFIHYITSRTVFKIRRTLNLYNIIKLDRNQVYLYKKNSIQSDFLISFSMYIVHKRATRTCSQNTTTTKNPSIRRNKNVYISVSL